jgi:hypothetical protein
MPDEDREKHWWLKSKFTLTNTRPKESKAAKISDIEQVEIVVDDHTPNEVLDDDMRRSGIAPRLFTSGTCDSSIVLNTKI